MMELEYHSRKRSISEGSGGLPAKMLCCRDEARVFRTSSANNFFSISPRILSPRICSEANSSTIVVFVFSEMVQVIASFLGDIASVGRFLCTCKDVVSSPSAPGVWRVVADAMYGVQRVLPLSFNYINYLREKIVWKLPISWEAVKIGTSPSGRSRAGVARLGDKIIVVGGHTRHLGEFMRERDVWCYDTELDTYSQVITSENRGPPQISRLGMESFDDVAYAFGGILQDKTKLNTISSFDLVSKEWRTVDAKGVPPSARCDPVTCAYQMTPERKGLIVLGGSQEGLLYYSDVHFFNIVTKTWERVIIDNEGPSPRIGATATILDHKMYVYGGAIWDSKTVSYTKHYGEMWCLHLGTGVWHWELLPNYGPSSPTGTLVNLTVVPIGNHLLVEGIMGQPLGYVYDTVSYTWSVVSPSGQSVNTSNFSSAVLVNSNIYYLCGYREHVLAQDVIKLSVAHIQEFIENGTLSCKEQPSTSSDVEMEEQDEEDEEEEGADGI